MEVKDMTYQQALTEMESILREMESGEPDVDDLSLKAKRVTELLQHCKDKLRSAQEKVQHIMDQMND